MIIAKYKNFFKLVPLTIFCILLLNQLSIARDTTLAIQLPWYKLIDYVPLYYAKNKGLFKKNKINLEIRHWSYGMNVPKLVEDGAVLIGFQDAIQFLQAVDNGSDLVAIAAPYQANPLVLVSLKEKKIKKIQDLNGKILGVPVGYGYLVNFIIKKYPFLKNNLTIKKYKHNHMVNLLIQNEIDVGIMYETTQAVLLRSSGHKINLIRYDKLGFNFYSSVIFVKKKFLENNKKILEKFFEIYIKTAIKLYRHPYKTVEYFSKYCLNYKNFKEYNFKNDLEYKQFLLASFKSTIFLAEKNTGEYICLMTEPKWKYMVNLLSKYKVIQNKPDIKKIMTNELLIDVYNKYFKKFNFNIDN